MNLIEIKQAGIEARTEYQLYLYKMSKNPMSKAIHMAKVKALQRLWNTLETERECNAMLKKIAAKVIADHEKYMRLRIA